MIAVDILDLTYLYSLSDGDKVFERLLLSGTVEELDKLIPELYEALQLKNIEVLNQRAHSLISLSAIAGITEIEISCREIELLQKKNVPVAFYELLVNKIFSIWPAAKIALLKILLVEVKLV